MIFSSLSTPKARAQALSKIVDAVLADRIDPEVARTLIYGIQAAQGLS